MLLFATNDLPLANFSVDMDIIRKIIFFFYSCFTYGSKSSFVLYMYSFNLRRVIYFYLETLRRTLYLRLSAFSLLRQKITDIHSSFSFLEIYELRYLSFFFSARRRVTRKCKYHVGPKSKRSAGDKGRRQKMSFHVAVNASGLENLRENEDYSAARRRYAVGKTGIRRTELKNIELYVCVYIYISISKSTEKSDFVFALYTYNVKLALSNYRRSVKRRLLSTFMGFRI